MKTLERIQTFEQIKTLADPRRLAVLHLLMARPATLTQLGHALGEHPAWVRHHVKLLEAAGLVEMSASRKTGGYVEKFYRAAAGAFLLQEMILPESGQPVVVLAGSHDLALEHLARLSAGVLTLTLPLGSVDGLVALRQGLCHAAGCHLLDLPSGEYNLPYVRHLFPDRTMTVRTLAYREQGLLFAPGNPRRIAGLPDLARPDVFFVNRNPGSGTRLWLDQQLERLGLEAQRIRGYERTVRTHTEVAQAIASGQADTGLGIRAAAQAAGLDFLPLFQERYDLVLPRDQLGNPALAPLFDGLQSAAFRRQAAALGGYDLTHSGETLAV